MDEAAPRLDKASKRRFNELVRAAKEHEAAARISLAVDAYRSASEVFGSEHTTLQKKIASLLRKLASSATQDAGAGLIASGSAAGTPQRKSRPEPPLVPSTREPISLVDSPGRSSSPEVVPTPAPSARTAPTPLTTRTILPAAERPEPQVPRKSSREADDLELPGGFRLNGSMAQRLFPHQLEGVSWMWSLHGSRVQARTGAATVSGGCLADDMGLGKTVQVVAFLSGLFLSHRAHCALVVAPLSVLAVWESEFRKWAPSIPVETFHGKRSARTIAGIARHGGVVLTTYGTGSSDPRALGASACQGALAVESDDAIDWEPAAAPAHLTGGSGIVWDVVVLDEGHKIKNPATQVHKAMRAIPSRYRLLLSGTPIQNNLVELWALVDWFTWGSLLGTRRNFNKEIADLITAGRDKDAAPEEMRRGEAAAAHLMLLLRPHLLRREKEVLRAAAAAAAPAAIAADDDVENLVARAARMDLTSAAAPPSMGVMGRKKEVVVWCNMPPPQVAAYTAFLESDRVASVLRSKSRSALTAITVLRKISCHPALLAQSGEEPPDGARMNDDEADDDEVGVRSPASAAAAPIPWRKDSLPGATELVAACGKLDVLLRLLRLLRREGHRILVFSQSSRMLDIMEHVLSAEDAGLQYLRVDGSVPGQERARIVREFNENARYSLCLLTTGVGSLGLTLTSATRVVIYDLSWNPSTDCQAVDRAYRLGQTRDVVTYRLISCGSIDESMYRLQLFKGGLTKSVMDGSGGGDADRSAGGGGASGWTARLLSRSDLRALFTLGSTSRSDTLALLDELALPLPASISAAVDAHLRSLSGELGGPARCCGVSHHDELLMLSSEDGGLQAQLRRARRAAAAAVPAIQLSPDRAPPPIGVPKDVAPPVLAPTSAPRRVPTPPPILRPAVSTAPRRAALVVIDSSDSDGSDDGDARTEPGLVAAPSTSASVTPSEGATGILPAAFSASLGSSAVPASIESNAAGPLAEPVSPTVSPTRAQPTRDRESQTQSSLFGLEAHIDLSQSPLTSATEEFLADSDASRARRSPGAEGSPGPAASADDSMMDDLLSFFTAPTSEAAGDLAVVASDSVDALVPAALQWPSKCSPAVATGAFADTDATFEGAGAQNEGAPEGHFVDLPAVLIQAEAALQSRDESEARAALSSVLHLFERQTDQSPRLESAEDERSTSSSSLHRLAMELAAFLGWLPA